MASNKGLGKGLGALLGDFEEVSSEKTPYQLLPIYKVEPNPDQPRRDFDEEELQALADSIAETCSGTAAVFSGSEEGGYAFCLVTREGDLRQLGKDMNAALQGRGGGKPGFFQGRVKATRKEIEALEEEIQQCEMRSEELSALLADGATYQDEEKSKLLVNEYKELEEKIPALYAKWEELQMLLE